MSVGTRPRCGFVWSSWLFIDSVSMYMAGFRASIDRRSDNGEK